MGRLNEIEEIAAGTIPHFSNLKMLVRGRPRYVDPQMESGLLRFATKRGFNCTAVIPNNQVALAEDAFKDSRRVSVTARPHELNINTLVRIGDSAEIGELHIVRDLIGETSFETRDPLFLNYSSDLNQNRVPVVSLVGTPCTVYREELESSDFFFCESWYQIVPGDVILLSPTPDVLPSLSPYEVDESLYLESRVGDFLVGEPATVFKYRIRLKTNTGRLPFKPKFEMKFFLKAQPIFIRDSEGIADVEIPNDMGPFLLDAFFGGLLISSKTETKIGVRLWDSFQQQLNRKEGGQQWQTVPSNSLILERPISADSFLFWQRITGNFQFQKKGFFLADLNEDGRFTMTSDLIVPKWPTDKERGWVIPVLARSAARCVIQFEPQPPQIFDIPANSLYFLRPRIFTEPHKLLLELSDDFVTGETKFLNFSKNFSNSSEKISFKLNDILIGPVWFETDHTTTINRIIAEINSVSSLTNVKAVLAGSRQIALQGKYPYFSVSNFVSDYGAPLLSVSQSRDIRFKRQFDLSGEQVKFVVNGVLIGPISFTGSHSGTLDAIIDAFSEKSEVTNVTAEIIDNQQIRLSSLAGFDLKVDSINGPSLDVIEVFEPYNIKRISFQLDDDVIIASSSPLASESIQNIVDAVQATERKRLNILNINRRANRVTLESATVHRFQVGQLVIIDVEQDPSFNGLHKITDTPTATSLIYEHIGKDQSLTSKRTFINGNEVIEFLGQLSPARAQVVSDQNTYYEILDVKEGTFKKPEANINNRTVLLIGGPSGEPLALTNLEIIFTEQTEKLRISSVPIKPRNEPIDRIIVSFQGSPNSAIEMRDWQYDGPTVNSFSYYLLGTGDVFGANKWAAGGVSLKPLFFNLKVLQARYSGIAHYNSGYIYV